MDKTIRTGVTDAQGVRARRMALLALFLVSAFNYMDRTILSILQIPIKAELGLSDSQLGALTGFTFALFYATLSLPIARLADRYSRRWIIIVSLVLWSSMTALCGLAIGFTSLAFFRIGVAIGEAGSVPASTSLIADYYPPAKRATAISSWGLALPAGLLIGYPVTGWLADNVGWRTTFAIVGIVGILLGPVVLMMLAEPKRGQLDPAPVAPQPPLPLGRSLALLWRNRVFRYLVMAGMLHGFSQYAMMTWNAPFFRRSFGLSLGEVASLLAVLSGAAGGVGIYVSGLVCDRLSLRDRRWPIWWMGIVVGATVPFALLQYFAASLPVAIGAAIGAGTFMIAYYGPIIATTQSVVPPQMRAFCNAVLLLSFNLFGLGLGPWVTGMLSDWLTPQFGEQALRYALVLVLVGSLLSAFMFFHAARFADGGHQESLSDA
ncbi:MFS transporter [Sphingobium sp.]|uniref:spinster family MFS transporter n=1 Tax=Sphingobium sp. TaxID=1912891 RepID=UPI0028BDD073|nr:MFS transporter [Sphingobium sp.]